MSETSAPQILTKTPWWLWPNVLSLDAPFVAVLWQAALATAYGVRLPFSCYMVLWLTVWLIYIVDRTLDGFSKTPTEQLSSRHAFYRRNRLLFVGFAIPIAIALLGLLALTAVPEAVFWRGVALGYVAGLYLLHYAARNCRWLFLIGNAAMCTAGAYVVWILPIPMTYKLWFSSVLMTLLALGFVRQLPTTFRLIPKEVFCGFIFAAGCSLCVSFYSMDSHPWPFSLETVLFAVLCALNCIGIACFDRDFDAKHDPNAITRTWPRVPRAYPLLLIGLCAMAFYAMSQNWEAKVIVYCLAVIASAALLGAVHFMAKRLKPELGHVLADVALVIPIAALLLV